MSDFYPKSASGLMQAYVAGVPFFQNSLLGNLAYTAIIFVGYFVLQRYVAGLKISFSK